MLLQPWKWWLIGIGHSTAAQGNSQPIARVTDYEPAVMLPFSHNIAILGTFEGPLKHFHNFLIFVLCNNLPSGNFLAGGSWNIQKLLFLGHPKVQAGMVCLQCKNCVIHT